MFMNNKVLEISFRHALECYLFWPKASQNILSGQNFVVYPYEGHEPHNQLLKSSGRFLVLAQGGPKYLMRFEIFRGLSL